MIKLLIQTYLVILAIPFLTYALDPKEPKTICDRLVGEKIKQNCVEIASKQTLDWYAASACNTLDDDDIFMKCWQKIVGGKFNPETLDFCTSHLDDADNDKLNCILSVKNKSISQEQIKKCTLNNNITEFQKCFESHSNRSPASTETEFQNLKIKGNK